MLRPRIHAPTLAKPRAAKSSSTPVVPPSLPEHLPERAGREDPFVQGDTADAQRVVEALVGAGAVAVEGYGKAVDAKLGHGCIPSG